jgi:hypothetical protein
MREWTQSALEQLIKDKIEESTYLEYKAADALINNDQKKNEIAKDVSSFANSDGGQIIYGIKEFQSETRYLPEKLDPINRQTFSKETLEQIINSRIAPRIHGLTIVPIIIGDPKDNAVVYVVDIPKSSVCHQASDKRYYRRFAFQSVPMDDWEIKDIMNRQKHPDIILEFGILHVYTPAEGLQVPTGTTETKLMVYMKNVGSIYCNYVNFTISLPSFLLPDEDEYDIFVRDEVYLANIYGDNTTRDIIGVKMDFGIPINQKGPARFVPILPGESMRAFEISLDYEHFRRGNKKEWPLLWELVADNAPRKEVAIQFSDIPQKNR